MTEKPNETTEAPFVQQADFERLTQMVSAEFQMEETLLEHGIPTFYLKQPQETKRQFLKLLGNLKPMNFVAFLRRMDGRLVLRILPAPSVKRGSVLVNWLLFFATIATTFITGYMLSSGMMDPFLGGAAFTVAIMTVLGMHEMSHKLTANAKGIEATPPYFIPGPPPVGGFLGIGTFGAVIMQKSLAPNKDALFDIGSSGPIIGFIVATIASIIGLPFSTYTWIPKGTATLSPPLLFLIIGQFLSPFGSIPPYPSSAHAGDYLLGIALHPVAFAGWVGIIITLLNLLPAAMLDGGHVARSIVGEKMRLMLTGLSILFLFFEGFYPMAILVLFMAMYKHPGPLDDVSSLSASRKLLTVALVAILILCASPILF